MVSLRLVPAQPDVAFVVALLLVVDLWVVVATIWRLFSITTRQVGVSFSEHL